MKSKLNKYRKVLVLLPLFVFTCASVYFLVAKFLPNRAKQNTADSLSKLNQTLPEPLIKEKEKTKLEAYMQSQEDSLKKEKQVEKQSSHLLFDPSPPDRTVDTLRRDGKRRSHEQIFSQEKRVNDQLSKILAELNKPSFEPDPVKPQGNIAQDTQRQNDISQLEQLVSTLHNDTTEDPEMKRLDLMLDKIIKIQNPAIQDSDRRQRDTFATTGKVELYPANTTVGKSTSSFFGLEPATVSPLKQRSAIKAVVHEDQTLQDGSVIKLRLTEKIYIGQQEIPAGNFIYGTCGISDERLLIDLDKIVVGSIIYPIKLSAYDIDGIAGISIPGAVTRDAAKQGLDRTIQTLGMTSLDPSLAAQVTTAGIQSLKSLLSKKVKQIKITVKAGHQVFLQ